MDFISLKSMLPWITSSSSSPSTSILGKNTLKVTNTLNDILRRSHTNSTQSFNSLFPRHLHTLIDTTTSSSLTPNNKTPGHGLNRNISGLPQPHFLSQQQLPSQILSLPTHHQYQYYSSTSSHTNTPTTTSPKNEDHEKNSCQYTSTIQAGSHPTNDQSSNQTNDKNGGRTNEEKVNTSKMEQTPTIPIKKFNNSESPFDITTQGEHTPFEKLLLRKLKKAFEPTAIIKIKDISDGCGSLYMVDVTSTKFDNIMMVKQHRMVMKALEEELKYWHGIHIVTRPVHKRRRRNKK